MTNSIDTEAIATAVTATSENIETTAVETSIDGLTTRLWVAPKITSEGLTAAELDAVLRVAYTESIGKVSTIEIRTLTPDDETIDVASAASELGIQHTEKIHSVTYSTEYLDEAYGE
jgi:hypothetical protein